MKPPTMPKAQMIEEIVRLLSTAADCEVGNALLFVACDRHKIVPYEGSTTDPDSPSGSYWTYE
jgi:hypothetical protein